MKNKFVEISVCIGLICTVFLGACVSNELEYYRLVQCEKLQCYADRRGQENFDNENWNTICELFASGKDEISRAKNNSIVDSIVSKTKISIDGIEPKEWDSSIDGVYRITDESWEAHIRMVAEEIGADESCVESVLNGGSAGEWSFWLRPKKYYDRVILNNKITVSGSRDYVYRIIREDNVYRGENATGSVTFWFQDEDLYFREGKETLQFYKDDSYRLTENSRTLTAPNHIRIYSDGEEHDFVQFQWNYDSDYGTHGIGVDVRKANENAYQTVKIEQVYMNQFVVELGKSKLAEGDNWVRLYSIGGPQHWIDNTMTMLDNSEYTLFCVTINGDRIKVKEV